MSSDPEAAAVKDGLKVRARAGEQNDGSQAHGPGVPVSVQRHAAAGFHPADFAHLLARRNQVVPHRRRFVRGPRPGPGRYRN